MSLERSKNNRNRIISIVTTIIFTFCTATSHSADDTPILLVLGDSLSAAYGIAQTKGWVSLLDQQLNPSSHQYRIVNASISGETTGGGLARLPTLLKKHDPDVIIVELGANDGLRGYPVTTMRGNLKKIITLSQQAGAKVLLAGMRIPPNYGSRYTRSFHESFDLLASEFAVPLIPFFLEGVAGNMQLTQADGLHPTAGAQPLILKNVMPYLKEILKPAG